MNTYEMKEQAEEACRVLERERDEVRERDAWLSGCINMMRSASDLLAKMARLEEELERSQREVDDLTAQIEQKDKVIDDLQRQLLEAENRQLEQANQQLETENRQLEAGAVVRPAEIHNHFGKGSSAQVFNDKVTGKILKIKKQWKRRDKRQETRRRA